ncbi:RNA polymerase sigma-70 factor [Sphingobacterium bovistauri]|uniref:RNA polymerase sigma-70 factor n=1 Tax=Sphingobacterium bovistauri TaxID=2781959 RepID=A0ABS7Z6Q8_9SPHI|nr:RNA polymerase sigma-70 factor [Sphingobacterium bovistauri]MCA5005871.1 RNA polymerase sigma-70 factor [Sphingobacterium bovistauri]
MNSIAVDYSELEDSDLWLLIRRDDEKAYTTIYNRYLPLLYIYVHKKLLNKQESQDITHEVLIYLWKNRLTIPENTNLAAYLFAAARNKAFDLFAHRKVEEKYITSLQNFIPTYTGTDYLLRENEIKKLIKNEIEALPPRMQEIFQLSRRDKLTNKEIAALLSLSTHTVDTQIKRALKILKNRLGPYFFLLFLFLEK